MKRIVVVALLLGCGGKAVVDGESSSSSSSKSSSSTASGTNPLCSTPAPVGQVQACGGTGSGGTCDTSNCDQDGNIWESSCAGTGCVCRFNGVQQCVCSLNGPGQFCTGSIPSCCPKPFPD